MSGEWKAGLYLASEDGATAAAAPAALATDPTWPMSMSSSKRWASPRPTLPFADLSHTRGVGVLMTCPHWLVYKANGRYLAMSDRDDPRNGALAHPLMPPSLAAGGSTRARKANILHAKAALRPRDMAPRAADFV
jgi:hypothetical protein